jgi:hypothetical protein
MIVFGADTHNRSHTIAAVSVMSGELLGERTVQSGAKGAAELLGWARGLPQARRRQEHQRRDPLPQAPPRPPHLAPPATASAHPGPDAHTLNLLT